MSVVMIQKELYHHAHRKTELSLKLDGQPESHLTANMPEWSKGVVLRTTKRKFAWVRTPLLA